MHLKLHPPAHRVISTKGRTFIAPNGLLKRVGPPEARFKSNGTVFRGPASWPSTLAYPNADVGDESRIEAEGNAFIHSRQEHTTEPFGKTGRE